MKKCFSLILAVLLAFTLVATVSAGGGKSSSSGSGEITIGISMDALDSQFWVANLNAMREEARKQGVRVVEVIAEGDAQRQNQQIDTLIAQKVSAIIIAPKDGTAIVSAIRKANSAGIPVIMNNRAASEPIAACTVGSDSKAMTKRTFEWITQRARSEGRKYVLLEFIGALTDVNAIDRHEGCDEVVKANPDVWTRIIPVNTDWKTELLDSNGQAALQANSSINAIWTPSDSQIPTVKAMLQKFNRYFPVGDSRHITWATLDGAKDAVDEVKTGHIDVVSVQDSVLTGQLCVQNAVALARGQQVQKNITEPGFEVRVDNWRQVGFDGY